MDWQPIETAPPLERIIVCGWQKATRGCVGYYWWNEALTDESGKCIDGKGRELFWCYPNLPKYPNPPVQS